MRAGEARCSAGAGHCCSSYAFLNLLLCRCNGVRVNTEHCNQAFTTNTKQQTTDVTIKTGDFIQALALFEVVIYLSIMPLYCHSE